MLLQHSIVLSGRFWGWQGEFDMQMSTVYGWEGRTYETVPVPVREEHRKGRDRDHM
jgi:hypothetical protein